MKKLSVDLEDKVFDRLEKESKDNMRSVGAQLRFVLKERYK